ncbi:MAG: phosphoribosylanthranilate isomerase, partial [Geminicoccaceae bacterium]
MAVEVKICGLKDDVAVKAAVDGGARYIGFMFYPPSPRAVTAEEAIALGRAIPADRLKVGVMVNPSDEEIEQVLPALDAIQLHGKETPERIKAIKEATGKLIFRSSSVGDKEDLLPLKAYAEVADMILFDAKPPKTPGSLPGGNGLSFDWRLLEGLNLRCPWMLAGGLHVNNLADAVR